MSDEDFVAQLAQFSSLEQMKNIADGIKLSNEWGFLQMQSINNTMAAGLIGKEIKANFKAVFADSENHPNITYSLEESAASVNITIKDENGDVVRRLTFENIDAGSTTFKWDGKDNLGNTVPEGYYSIEASASDYEGNEFTPSLSLVGLVQSINYRDGAGYLVINGTEIPMGGITAIGEPGSLTED